MDAAPREQIELESLTSREIRVEIENADPESRSHLTGASSPAASGPAGPGTKLEFIPEDNQAFPSESAYKCAPKSTGDHWETCLAAVEKYDNERCASWKDEMDTLLVFAGLFTAIVTAVTIESYKWLKPDPLDINNQLLLVISRQLANSSEPAAVDPVSQAFQPTALAVRVNCFWFVSIALSLTAGLVGILCKQWIHEFQKDAALPSQDALALRQLRLLGWESWGVPHFISSPALLLQTSLFLFFAGILDLLWSSGLGYRTVAIFTSIVVAFAALIVVVTTLAPTLYYSWSILRPSFLSSLLRVPKWIYIFSEKGTSHPCPFKSPQSLLAMRVLSIMQPILFIFYKRRGREFILQALSTNNPGLSWVRLEYAMLRRKVSTCGQWKTGSRGFDVHLSVLRYQSLALQWIRYTLGYNSRVCSSLTNCVLDDMDARVAMAHGCKQRHLWFAETNAACKDNEPLRTDMFLLNLTENPMFQLELALRVAVAKGYRASDSNKAPRQRILEVLSSHRKSVPATLYNDLAQYFKTRIDPLVSNISLTWEYNPWRLIFLFALLGDTPDRDKPFKDILAFATSRIAESQNSLGAFQHGRLSTPFFLALAEYSHRYNEIFQDIHTRCIYPEFMDLLKVLHPHLPQGEEHMWIEVKQAVLRAGNLTEDFFDDPDAALPPAAELSALPGPDVSEIGPTRLTDMDGPAP